MKKFANVVVCAACAVVAWMASAAWVSEQDARKAAEAFVKRDAVGRVVLSGCDVAAISQRGNIWVVALSPSGQVLLSRSDLADPIVGFSKNDFSEPDPDSPAYAYLAGIDASLAALESNGGTRHDRWDRLLAGGTGKRLLAAADADNSDTIVIPPFLESHYNQWQPYNDYSPVFEPDENYFESGYEPYRGRCPCGCVATAAAQGFRHFRWPARMDRVDSFNHNFTDTNRVVATTPFPLRFDGHLPMDWAALEDRYDSDAGGEWVPDPDKQGRLKWKTHSDLRGTVPEATRYPIARLIMFADVLAHMSFGADDSSANYGTVAANASDWYTQGTWVSPTDDRVQADIMNGVPVQVTIPGHAVVGHGWANDGTDTYIYLNYGWGGGNDGYYNINGTTIQSVYVGHYPRAKPQIDPLPAMCGTSLSLNWHFPDFYTNRLSGFTVSLKKTATETSTYAENFSASSGVATGDEGIFKVGTHSKGYDGNLLYCVSAYDDGQYAIVNSAYYTFPEVYMLTSASVLTLKLRSWYALSNGFEVQARFNGGGWITIMSPSLAEDSDSGWGAERLYLGNHGGETIQLRFYKAYTGGSCYTGQDCIFVDDVVLTDVLVQGAETTRNVAASARSYTCSGLDAGSTCTFAITPIMSGALVAGESSEPLNVSVEGTHRTPIPGEETYLYDVIDTAFSTTDNTVWSYSGNAVDGDQCAISSQQNLTITANCLQTNYVVAADSVFSFDWAVRDTDNYLGSNYDLITVSFVDATGTVTTIDQWQNCAGHVRTTARYPLASFAGQKGNLKISVEAKFVDVWSYYPNRLTIYGPKLTNLTTVEPVVPDVEWKEETLTALGMPEILSVTTVDEGFYAECELGETTFEVICSEGVTSLEARPSHLALVGDNDVSVTPKGNGRFTVTVTPSGITEDNVRSRMILTLAATDANGTVAYKDLSLRFAPVDDVASAVTVNAKTSSGNAFSVDIPHEWIETSGLVPSGSAASAYEAALAAAEDADGDGIPNWAEYVCGTSPTNSSSKLTATIRMENDVPVVSYEPSDRIANGFKAVIKGTNNLSEDFSNWQVTTGTTSLHFFRVEIVPE